MRKAPWVRLACNDKLRNWFYYQARRATGRDVVARLRGAYSVEMIGDAVHAGKSEEAIASAFAAAFGTLDADIGVRVRAT